MCNSSIFGKILRNCREIFFKNDKLLCALRVHISKILISYRVLSFYKPVFKDVFYCAKYNHAIYIINHIFY